jgi:fatty-acyl-CoA synthase
VLGLDKGETARLNARDTVVENGVRHARRNLTAEPAFVFFVFTGYHPQCLQGGAGLEAVAFHRPAGFMSTAAKRPVNERLLGASIALAADEEPSRQALAFGDDRWTYAQFDHAIGVVAAGLAAAGVTCGDFVLMAGTARPEALFTLFALARLGAVAVPVLPSSTQYECDAFSAAVHPAATVGDTDFLARTRTGGLRLCWDAGLPDAYCLRPDADLKPVDEWHSAPADPVIVAFTSGTSGRAKAVVLTHQNLYSSVQNAVETLDIGPSDKVLIATPLAHAAVFAGMAQHAWTVRGSVVLAPRFDPELFIDIVREHGVTTTFAVAVMLERLIRTPRWAVIAGSSLRWLLLGGGPAAASLTVAFTEAGITVINSYGLTEASGGVTYARPEEVAEYPRSAGPPGSHIELRIATTDGQAAGRGAAGEIWLRGPSVAQEYLTSDGERTPAADEAGWLRTGDRGMLDHAGRLFVCGRIKDTIVTGGENVEPAEVEDALGAMAGLRDLAVLGLPDPVWGEVVTVVVVLEPGATAGLDDIRTYLQARLARHKIPRRLIVIDALPRTATGKLQRGKLLEAISDSAKGTLDLASG